MSAPIALMDRIEGATWPDTTLLLTENGSAIANLASYTWTIEAAASKGGTELWTKSTSITASSAGVVIAWAAADMGALVASSAPYWFEMTGTYQTKPLKYYLTQKIDATIA